MARSLVIMNRSDLIGAGQSERKSRSVLVRLRTFSERSLRPELLGDFRDLLSFTLEIPAHGRLEPCIREPVHGVGRLRQVAARQLVLALRAGFGPREFVGDGELDGLIVAKLEMQEGAVLDGAPVAAIEAIAADEMQGAGDISSAL